jgi:DNA mismatch endonuclease (patch repair protein)
MDRLTIEKRSWNMSRIRGKNTKPEMVVRRFLYSKGVRYRLHATLPGKPDLVIAKKVAVFVNGCFWHCHTGCAAFRIPKTRSEFWAAKLEGNVARDNANYKKLTDAGLRIIVVWECELKIKNADAKLMQVLEEINSFS